MEHDPKWRAACAWLAGAVLVLAGCSSAPATSNYDRKAGTGVEPEQRISIVLESYYAEGGQATTESRSSYIEGCIRKGMRSVNRSLQFVTAADALKAVYPAPAFATAPRSPDDILAGLETDGRAALWASLGVRYVVTVTVHVSDTRSSIDGWGAGKLGFGGTAKWRETADFNATVVDIPNARIAGSVQATASGDEAAGVHMILILPIPHGYDAATEASACRELGRSLAAFLAPPPE